MMKEKIVNFLGLAMRAGKVKTGESVIVNEIKKHKIQLVIIAEDASENTKKVIQNKCESYHISFRIFGTRSELGQALGKAERVNVGITDQGFAKKLLSMIEEYRKE
ncbi:L7Ae/L30e/S12e/Gadd45 family ribosomal protein [Staphylococcus kloosii]|jgi:ribosomal protein L7Ae-like RNA K-turn-binding protein|uniref:L7Ae/L30e/S12e/Gadd45 family ribosomal protein n=1 Tax=Staphylococcus kloosii TaxID=29384 RepID=UPI00189D63CD|nr:ribosomal L7Ae/L30e/S12e/Gadd45 family protein [Staphylococcus kloosii]MBF7024071.1 ribosomal L7Ae/L30e/S12e/Gadd45 family protein [Staphylococcus kloosii]